MAKWYGNIGYELPKEIEPGLWVQGIVERSYFGDMTSDRRKRHPSGEVNDNLNLANIISIIADPFAVENCSHMIYADYMGVKWKITEVEVLYPRLTLTIGGVYNEDQTGTTE